MYDSHNVINAKISFVVASSEAFLVSILDAFLRPRPLFDTFADQSEAGYGCERANGIRRRVFF